MAASPAAFRSRVRLTDKIRILGIIFAMKSSMCTTSHSSYPLDLTTILLNQDMASVERGELRIGRRRKVERGYGRGTEGWKKGERAARCSEAGNFHS